MPGALKTCTRVYVRRMTRVMVTVMKNAFKLISSIDVGVASAALAKIIVGIISTMPSGSSLGY